jgi:hypothetical protein
MGDDGMPPVSDARTEQVADAAASSPVQRVLRTIVVVGVVAWLALLFPPALYRAVALNGAAVSLPAWVVWLRPLLALVAWLALAVVVGAFVWSLPAILRRLLEDQGEYLSAERNWYLVVSNVVLAVLLCGGLVAMVTYEPGYLADATAAPTALPAGAAAAGAAAGQGVTMTVAATPPGRGAVLESATASVPVTGTAVPAAAYPRGGVAPGTGAVPTPTASASPGAAPTAPAAFEAAPHIPSRPIHVLWAMLLTAIVAGALGGTLCNLRGLFKYNRDNRGQFPTKFERPFYIRPFMAALVGLFSFFLGSFLNSALSSAAGLSWTTLTGRMPYIAVALMAGFVSQEFMERLKEVAVTLFATDAANDEDAQAQPGGDGGQGGEGQGNGGQGQAPGAANVPESLHGGPSEPAAQSRELPFESFSPGLGAATPGHAAAAEPKPTSPTTQPPSPAQRPPRRPRLGGTRSEND